MTGTVRFRYLLIFPVAMVVLAGSLLISSDANAQCANCHSCGGGEYQTTVASESSKSREDCAKGYCTVCNIVDAGAASETSSRFLAVVPENERIRRVEMTSVFGFSGVITQDDVPDLTLADLTEAAARFCPSAALRSVGASKN